jgi:hypothetical protein
MVRQGKQGTVIRIDDNRIAIYTKSMIARFLWPEVVVADICRYDFLCVQALHIQPADKAVIYNIAMIQQKSAELLFSLPPAKRTLAELERGIARAVHAQKMFGSLAADPANAVPYDRDLAEERKKYADSMLRRSEEHMSAQRQYEAEQTARLEGARQKRAAERERVEALEVRPFLSWVHYADVDNSLLLRANVDSANERRSLDSRLKCSRWSAQGRGRRLSSGARTW